jgi:lysozyme family protein
MTQKYSNSYNKAFERVGVAEGGFQDDPRDRANWTSGKIGEGTLKGTNCGISAMTYPHLDIKNLTTQQIKEIYYNDFWLPVGGDNYPKEIVYQFFDACIHHGLHNTKCILQRAVGAKDDGVIGPRTMEAVKKHSIHDLLKLFLAERLDFMTNTKVWDTYGKGWARRIAKNLRYAAQDTEQ